MRGTGRLGFTLQADDVIRDILVPHYYDPRIAARLAELESTHELVSVGSLINAGHLELRQGNYIGKIHYGSGAYPYIRTSDLANWELRGSPKHGVSQAVYDQWAAKQDVRPGDVLLVHEGTYLIGTTAYVTTSDHRFLFQHHLAKLRPLEGSPLVGGALLAALLSAPIVQAQIRSKQFTADIIDSIVGRFLEVVLPIPRDKKRRASLASRAEAAYEERALRRVALSRLFGRIDEILAVGEWTDDEDEGASSFGAVLGGWTRARSFSLTDDAVKGDILLPRYYDPATARALEALAPTSELVTVGELVAAGVLSLTTGHEVGKLAYGTGTIPFVRTSDLGNWELKRDPKQLVSQAIYDSFSTKQSVKARDILLVRDGTYLVGNSAIVTDADLPMLFSGGMYRIRVTKPSKLDPFLLLALLNSTTVRQQMRDKQFTRDVIDTLGQRFLEVVLPLPRSADLAAKLAEVTRTHVQRRSAIRRDLVRLGPELEIA